MEVLKDKIKKVCFWDKIHSGDLVAASKRRQSYVDTNRKYTPIFRFTDIKTDEEIALGKKIDAAEVKRIKRKFPKDSNVYHFYPILFLEQMKMICGNGRAPWM